MKYHVIGLMSGSSLDGLDIAYCRFVLKNDHWEFSILESRCVEYSPEWVEKLRTAPSMSGLSLKALDSSYAEMISMMVQNFIDEHNITDIDLLASHGHTVFHYPEQLLTLQIGNGGIISSTLGLPVVSDMRSSDVALGGQGTPMVAITDLMLFREYQALINIGGIANITVNGESLRSYDICVANQVLNLLAREKGQDFDKDGEIAARGKVNKELLGKLNAIEFFQKESSKSLDNSFTANSIMPVINTFEISVEDKLATFCEHIVIQIELQLRKFEISDDAKILLSGGGALNKHLISKFSYNVSVADREITDYKEALATAFSGLLRMLGEVNFKSECTGASRDSSNGAIYSA